MRLILLILGTIALVGCGAPSATNETAGGDTVTVSVHAHADLTTGVLAGPPFVLEGCYEMTMNRDTAQLTLEVQDTIVHGKLSYNWFERDGNAGTLKGVLRDSLIVANYTFQAEGLTSVQEVIFKIEDTTLLQGFGDIDNKNGRVVFRNPAQLQYTQANPFVKVPCP